MRIQDGFFGKRIFPERKFTVDFEWIMKSVIRSRMYRVFQNGTGDRTSKNVSKTKKNNNESEKEYKIFSVFESRLNMRVLFHTWEKEEEAKNNVE